MNLQEKMAHRIEPFFLNMTQRIELFSKMWKRIEPFFLPYDAKNSSFYKTQKLFFLRTKFKHIFSFRIDFFKMTQIIETLNKYDSKELNLFDYHMTQKNWTFIEPFFLKKKVWLKDLNFFFFEIWLKRIESFFSRNMTQKELNLFFIRNMTQKELNLFSLENWTFFFKYDSRELNFFVLDMIQRIEPFVSITQSFSKMIQRFFLKNKTTQRIEIFYNIWLKELTLFFWTYVQKLILFRMIHRIEPSLHDSKNWTFFFWKYDSENWTFCKYDWKNWTFFHYDSKNGTFFFSWIWRKELNFFFWMGPKDLNLFWEKFDS